MTGEIFNQFCEHLIWTNYGGPVVTILGRDIAVFIVGYLTRIVIECIICSIQEKRRNKKDVKKHDDV